MYERIIWYTLGISIMKHKSSKYIIYIIYNISIIILPFCMACIIYQKLSPKQTFFPLIYFRILSLKKKLSGRLGDFNNTDLDNVLIQDSNKHRIRIIFF